MLAIKYKWMLPVHLKQSSIPNLSAWQGNAGMKEESSALQRSAVPLSVLSVHTWATSHPL